MKREISDYLLAWKNSPGRRILLLRGARQVGKTYSLRILGQRFSHFLEVNFEEHPEVKTFFEGPLTPRLLCEKLSGYFDIPIIPGETLLFFDEIQACPNCLASLRFFHEKMPELHVAAAGSLLEFVLNEIPSFGVGRIESIFMYPMTFSEFVAEVEGKGLADVLANADPFRPIELPFHQRLMDAWRRYLVIGGLPAAVHAYLERRDLRECQTIIDSLIETLRDDFRKYRRHAPIDLLTETFRSIALQAGGKFKYSTVSLDATHYELRKCLGLLMWAGLGYQVYHSDARGVPLGAQVDLRRFKALVFDAGAYQRLCGLDLSAHLVEDDAHLVNRGGTAELAVGLELAANSGPMVRPELYYWHREARGSNAEVDYVIQHNREIVPLEVKSGGTGAMKSMHLFLQERSLSLGIRLSQENVARYGSIQVLPVYLAGLLARGELIDRIRAGAAAKQE
jgi:hypothetical protein